MSDTIGFSITPEQFSGLTDAGKASLEATLAKAGASPEYIASLKGSAGAAPPTKPAALPFGGNGAKPPADVALVPSTREGAGIPAGERVAAFKRLRGVVPDATLQEAAKAEGVAWNEITSDAPPADTRLTVEEANARLAATSAPDAGSLSPSDFQFTFDPAHIAELPPDEVRAINDVFADGFHAAGVPLSLGPALFREAMNAADKFADLGEVDRQLAFREEGARLQRLGNAEQIKADAEFAWSKLPQDFKDFASEHFLFHSADAYAALANAGAMMKARESRKGRQ